jgi:deazaflavin-dependent oxidoreductase (nitroreductase family)
VLVLETVGRRSGKRRANPVWYLRDGNRLVVCAANAGAGGPPSWWQNLAAAGEGTVTLGRERIAVRGREAGPEERKALWPRYLEEHPSVGHYPTPNGPFPLIVLEPKGP